jgi:two-component system chemotaxis response regulator CheB
VQYSKRSRPDEAPARSAPADADVPRTAPFDIVVIAASAGGFRALQRLLASLPANFPVPIAIVQHRSAKAPNVLAPLLQRRTALRVTQIERAGGHLERGNVYIAPPDQHLLVNLDRTFALTDGQKIRSVRSSANPLFTSAAGACGDRVVAVVLTGGDSDGTDGVQSVKAVGGVVIAQDPATAEHRWMPLAAVNTGSVDYVLPLDEIGPLLVRLAAGEPRR